MVQVPGCVYPAEVLVCAPKTVPVDGEFMLALIIFGIALVGYLSLRGRS